MEDLVTVVVPVYNVESYVEDCIRSIMNQTYKNIEIIIVNDGSTDSSGEVCKKIQKEDSRIRYYEKKNGGLSDARNFGIGLAKGRYIFFADSDDLVSKYIIQYLIKLIQSNDSQIAIASINHFYEGDEPNYINADKEVVYSKTDALLSFLYQKDISTSACGKLFSISLWEKVKFPIGKLFEDNIAMFEILALCDKVVYGNAQFYGYRHRKDSITTKKFTAKDMDILEIGKIILEQSKKIGMDVYMSAIAYQCSNCLRIYLNAPYTDEFEETINYCKDFIKKNCKPVLRDKNIRKKLRVALILFRIKVPRWVMIKLHGKAKRW